MYVPFSDTTGASSTVIRRSLLYLTAFILGLLGPHYLCNGPRVGLRQSRGDARFAPWLCPPRSCQHLLELRDGSLRHEYVLKAHERHRIDFPRFEHEDVRQVARAQINVVIELVRYYEHGAVESVALHLLRELLGLRRVDRQCVDHRQALFANELR